MMSTRRKERVNTMCRDVTFIFIALVLTEFIFVIKEQQLHLYSFNPALFSEALNDKIVDFPHPGIAV